MVAGKAKKQAVLSNYLEMEMSHLPLSKGLFNYLFQFVEVHADWCQVYSEFCSGLSPRKVFAELHRQSQFDLKLQAAVLNTFSRSCVCSSQLDYKNSHSCTPILGGVVL